MKKIKKLFLWLFVLSYIFLFCWAFQDFRLWFRIRLVSLLGFGKHPGVESFQEDIPLSWYDPQSMMRPATEHLPERPMFETIEFHGHIFPNTDSDIKPAMQRERMKYFINLALRTTTEEDYRSLLESRNEPHILHFPGLNWKRTTERMDFGSAMADDLEKIAKLGARGIKVWKNFGLYEKKQDGSLITMDDPALDPIWDVCARLKLLVAIHTADPPAFFNPLDEKNERLPELLRHPDWSFTASSFPAFDTILEQRERLFTRRPDVAFVALHFGELGQNISLAARTLDRHPNVYFDIAQRIDELGRQPLAARAFLIKYQDRILYGTDGPPDYEKARIYWRFLETADEYFDYHPGHKPGKGIWKISGLNLPPAVLQKIYYRNAARLLRL